MLVKIGSKWHFYVHVADLFLYSAHYLTFDDLTQCLRKKVVVRGINFRFFKYFAMEWWGGMVWPPSGPKKFGRTHWAAGLGRFRCQNRQKEANWRRKTPHKSFNILTFLTFGGSNMTRRVAQEQKTRVSSILWAYIWEWNFQIYRSILLYFKLLLAYDLAIYCQFMDF